MVRYENFDRVSGYHDQSTFACVQRGFNDAYLRKDVLLLDISFFITLLVGPHINVDVEDQKSSRNQIYIWETDGFSKQQWLSTSYLYIPLYRQIFWEQLPRVIKLRIAGLQH